MHKTAVDEVRLLGDYKLIKQIGQGPLGAVFLGEHRFTKQHYAIKILPEELAADRGFLQRFEEEIIAISTLDHPHIVKIHNVSFSQGLYFLVSDCIADHMGESTNLLQYFNSHKRRLEEEELIAIATQLAGALDYAHGLKNGSNKKLAHRGLKLNNILIGTSSTGALSIAISDFGLTHVIGQGACLTRGFKAVAEALAISTVIPSAKIGQDRYPFPAVDNQKLLPLHQSFLQNIAFLAPEQKKIDVLSNEKADVYAFGVLFYYLLMNEFPEGIFPLPSTKRGDLTWNWDRLIQECLKQNPDERPTCLEELILRASTCIQEPAAIEPDNLEEMLSTTMERKFTEVQATPSHSQIDLFGLQEQAKKSPPIIFQTERVVKEYYPEKREANKIEPLLSEIVQIRGGYHYRGSSNGCRDEMPRHQVKIAPFALDVHPVTNEQFVRFLDAIGEEKDPQHHDILRLRDSRVKKSSGRFLIEPGYAKHPVVGVTWYGAVAYAKWVGRRLPTEAEWEIACCGGLDNPTYPTGESIEKSQANFFSSDTTAVMSYPPNEYGLYDMAGNVYEWCQDWYEYAYYEASAQEPEYPKGPLQGVYRVLRGGCWKSLKEDLRCTKRHRNNPGAANGTYGFRCAADLVQ